MTIFQVKKANSEKGVIIRSGFIDATISVLKLFQRVTILRNLKKNVKLEYQFLFKKKIIFCIYIK